MQKKLFKDHIAFYFEGKDSFSNLGAKTLFKQKNKILQLRMVTKDGEPVLICSTEGMEKVDCDRGLSGSRITKILKDLADLLALCEESAFLDTSYINVSKNLLYYSESKDKYFFVIVPVVTSDYDTHKKDFEDKLTEFVKGLFFELTTPSDELESFRNRFLSATNKSAFIQNEAGSLSVYEDEQEKTGTDLELVYSGSYGDFSLFVCKDEFVIGQAQDCDGVLFMNQTVSRHHCIIRRIDTGWLLADLGSSNGTFVGDARLAPNQSVILNNNDRIRVSDMEFIVKTNR